MLDSTFIIENLHDMSLVEKRIVELYQGEKGRCSILNSAMYLRFRLTALYRQQEEIVQITGDKLKMTLVGPIINLFYIIDDIKLPKDDYTSKGNKKRIYEDMQWLE